MTHAERAARRQAIAADVARGLTPAEAGAKHRVTLTTVHSACQAHGVSWRALGLERRAARRKLMAAEVAAGLTVAEIAAKYGVSLDLVYRACQEHGVAC